MKNYILILGFFLSINAFSEVISDVTVVKQNMNLEGSKAEDLYDALSDLHDPVCTDDGCKHVVSVASCTQMSAPIQMDTCTAGFEGQNEQNQPAFHFITSMGKNARNLIEAMEAVTNKECSNEPGVEVCAVSIKEMNCQKTGPWYWRSYQCALEL